MGVVALIILTTPVNAIDPDGHLVIFIDGFINGFTNVPSEQGTSKYWQREVKVGGERNVYTSISFDKMVVDHFGDNYNKSIYLDGSLGGVSGLLFRNSTDAYERWELVYRNGKVSAKKVIQSLKRSGGVITESIKVVAHSMGGSMLKDILRL